jgi:hypothetical protein
MEFVGVEKETEKYAWVNYSGYKGIITQQKQKKFLCVGGEFAGLYKCWAQTTGQGYIEFNNAGRSKNHTMIYVHESLL